MRTLTAITVVKAGLPSRWLVAGVIRIVGVTHGHADAVTIHTYSAGLVGAVRI
jgi:hypothetical protein